MIDIFGHMFFLVPVASSCSTVDYRSSEVLNQNEQSENAGGFPVWPAKFMVPFAFVLLIIQGMSEMIKRRAIMSADLQDTASGGGHHAAAEAEAKRFVGVAGRGGGRCQDQQRTPRQKP